MNRRDFVTTTVGSLALTGVGLTAQGRRSNPIQESPDPVEDLVMGQTNQELKRLNAELKNKPKGLGALRSLESTLTIGAAHVQKHVDPEIRRALKRINREHLINQMVDAEPKLTRQKAGQVIAALEKHGLSEYMRDHAKYMRLLHDRLEKEGPLQRVSATNLVQSSCQRAEANYEFWGFFSLVLCLISIGVPVLVPGCIGASAIALGMSIIMLWEC